MSPSNAFDFDLLIDHGIWGSEVLPCEDGNFEFSGGNLGASTVITQFEHDSQAPNTVSTFDTFVITATDSTPETFKATSLAVSQVTTIDTRPATPKAPSMAISQVTAIDTRPATPKAPSMVISQVTATDTRPTTSRATPLTMSKVEAVFSYKEVQVDRGDGEGCSRHEQPENSVCKTAFRKTSNSIITDTNHGLPIVIDDTDDESQGMEAMSRVDASAHAVSHYSEFQSHEQPTCRHNFRKRARPKHEGKVEWTQSDHEKQVLRELRSAFYQHESQWMKVRELPEAVEDVKVRQHDLLVQDFGKTCRDTEMVSVEDTSALRQSHIDLMSHLLDVIRDAEQKSMLKNLEKLLDEIEDHATTLSSIYAYRTGDSDTRDKTYRPFKKRKGSCTSGQVARRRSGITGT